MPNAAPERTFRDATRWASNADMADAIAIAEQKYLANPSYYNDPKIAGTITFDMERIIGDGYAANTAEHLAARQVTVRFNTSTGKPYTAYPVIETIGDVPQIPIRNDASI